ncbi:unnamed protein product, partial [marine sediment metagenome]
MLAAEAKEEEVYCPRSVWQRAKAGIIRKSKRSRGADELGVSRLQRMHSAEHILTAVMRREFGSPRNLELHLGNKKSKCDYAVSQALLQEDILTIERAVNAEIEKDYPITVQVLPIEEAQQ